MKGEFGNKLKKGGGQKLEELALVQSGHMEPQLPGTGLLL